MNKVIGLFKTFRRPVKKHKLLSFIDWFLLPFSTPFQNRHVPLGWSMYHSLVYTTQANYDLFNNFFIFLNFYFFIFFWFLTILSQINRAPSYNTDTQLDYDIKSALLTDSFRLLNLKLSDKRKGMAAQKAETQKRLMRPTRRAENDLNVSLWYLLNPLCRFCHEKKS